MIGLVSCSSVKLDRAAPARELYAASALFRKSLAYAEARCEETFVLSALHGVVDLEQMIEPYDHRLGAALAAGVQWGVRVVAGLVERNLRNRDLFILAGASYARPLVIALRGARWTGAAYEPLAGKQIGDRLAFLNAELGPEAAANPKKSRVGEYARYVKPYKDANAAAGLCLHCPSPVAKKKDGTPAKLCQVHLDADRDRNKCETRRERSFVQIGRASDLDVHVTPSVHIRRRAA